MSSPNECTRETRAWLAQVNAANFNVDEEFGKFTADTDDDSSTNLSSAGADDSLDSD